MTRDSLHNRINANQIADRLDSEYYTKGLLENEAELGRFGQSKLSELVDDSKQNNIADLTSNGSFEFLRGIQFNKLGGVPFIRTQNLMDGYVDDSDIIYVNEECRSMIAKSICETGDLIVCRKGKVGAASAVPRRMDGAAISENITRFSIRASDDGDFFAAFFNSSQGRKRFLREATGVIQKWVNTEKLRDVKAIRLNSGAERYIGDKVRQAELLRKTAAQCLKEANSILEECLHWNCELGKSHRSRRLKSSDLADRLDGNFNSPVRLLMIDHLNAHRIHRDQLSKLADVSAMIGWKGLTTEHYTETGPWLLRGLEIENGVIDFDALVSVAREKYDEQPQIHLQKGDLALSKDGTIGKAAVVPELPQEMAVGSTVARLRLRDQSGIHPYYMEHVLNHDVLQIQIRSYATGMAQPHITQEWIERLEIPRCRQEDKIANLVKKHHSAIARAKDLTLVARFLVEALIEHRVSESELVAVQKACERGDRRGERSLLSRMTRKGMDVPRAPVMFLDLDALDEPVEHAADTLMPAEVK
jgi:type I restriction enzyme S subunit